MKIDFSNLVNHYRIVFNANEPEKFQIVDNSDSEPIMQLFINQEVAKNKTSLELSILYSEKLCDWRTKEGGRGIIRRFFETKYR